MRKRRAADLFCGAGGTTAGAEDSGYVECVFALNHWSIAVSTHLANFPHAKHANSRLEHTNPTECPKIHILFASPECTHHSRAAGGRPTSDQQRCGAWYVMPWLEHHRPDYMVIENVMEFRDWGPVDPKTSKPIKKFKGQYFDAWVMAIQSYGYKVDWQIINAADHGAITSRSRLFLIARKGKRETIWPEPSHKRFGEDGLLPWRAAYESIDWTIPAPSIFRRNRPLKDKTLLRLDAGLHRFVEPFVVQFRNNMSSSSKDEPLSTITAGGRHHGLAVPFVAQWDNHGGNGSYVRGVDVPMPTFVTKANAGIAYPFLAEVNHGDDGHKPDARTMSPNDIMGAITAKNGRGIAIPFQFQLIGSGAGRSRDIGKPLPTIIAARELHGMALPFISKQYGTKNGTYNPNVSIEQPLGTVTTTDHNALVIPWLIHYYGTNNQSPVTDPLDTITTRGRHAMAAALCSGPADWPAPTSAAMEQLQKTMRELELSDLAFRMFQNAELALAQGFHPDYIFHGNKAQVTRQIGNSVSPVVARAISTAIAS